MKIIILILAVSFPAYSYAQTKNVYTKDGNYVGKVTKDSSNSKRENIYNKYGSYDGRIESYGNSREKIVYDKYGNRTATIRK